MTAVLTGCKGEPLPSIRDADARCLERRIEGKLCPEPDLGPIFLTKQSFMRIVRFLKILLWLIRDFREHPEFKGRDFSWLYVASQAWNYTAGRWT